MTGVRAVAVLPAVVVALAALVLVPPPLPPTATATAATATATAADEPGPRLQLSQDAADKGTEITVSGTGWRPRTLLMLLVCGRSAPGKGVIGGTNSCANADGRAVTTDADGAFTKPLPVTAPPEPCPCVVHVATVTGEQATADAVLKVTGHPVRPLPAGTGTGRIAVLTTVRLEGSSGLLVRFGAPASRRVVLTVGNLGSGPVVDPVFEVGTAHGVYAPQWEEHQWRGTVPPGGKARVELPVRLPAGAHGDYQVSVRYGGRLLAEHPWGVARPWGVTLFWVLLAVVVPAALFRIGMAVVDRVRPPAGRRRAHSAPPDARAAREPRAPAAPSEPSEPADPAAGLPWFAPDSAPSENAPTTKGQS
ncbi:hypothetical protein [Streptomyces sp. NPDC047928]|uniref:hypothetical protein n=1 Tax=unclassified Streptomyces TaxID=2593676 RepID=UPI0037159A86